MRVHGWAVSAPGTCDFGACLRMVRSRRTVALDIDVWRWAFGVAIIGGMIGVIVWDAKR